MFLNCSSVFFGSAVLAAWADPLDCAFAPRIAIPQIARTIPPPTRNARIFPLIIFASLQNHGSLPNSSQSLRLPSSMNPRARSLPRANANVVKAFTNINAAQKTAPCPSPPAPPHQKIPPSSPAKSGRPRSPACPDQDCADYSWNCHTTLPPAAWSPPSIPAVRPACNSTASESDSSPATAAPRFHRRAQCHIQNASHVDAYAETNSAASHRSAAFPAPPRVNHPPLEESAEHDYSTAA